ncbi:hypothetical protein JCM10207_000078 [Rhodosporidiobolus poonsookiae]
MPLHFPSATQHPSSPAKDQITLASLPPEDESDHSQPRRRHSLNFNSFRKSHPNFLSTFVHPHPDPSSPPHKPRTLRKSSVPALSDFPSSPPTDEEHPGADSLPPTPPPPPERKKRFSLFRHPTQLSRRSSSHFEDHHPPVPPGLAESVHHVPSRQPSSIFREDVDSSPKTIPHPYTAQRSPSERSLPTTRSPGPPSHPSTASPAVLPPLPPSPSPNSPPVPTRPLPPTPLDAPAPLSLPALPPSPPLSLRSHLSSSSFHRASGNGSEGGKITPPRRRDSLPPWVEQYLRPADAAALEEDEALLSAEGMRDELARVEGEVEAGVAAYSEDAFDRFPVPPCGNAMLGEVQELPPPIEEVEEEQGGLDAVEDTPRAVALEGGEANSALAQFLEETPVAIPYEDKDEGEQRDEGETVWDGHAETLVDMDEAKEQEQTTSRPASPASLAPANEQLEEQGAAGRMAPSDEAELSSPPLQPLDEQSAPALDGPQPDPLPTSTIHAPSPSPSLSPSPGHADDEVSSSSISEAASTRPTTPEPPDPVLKLARTTPLPPSPRPASPALTPDPTVSRRRLRAKVNLEDLNRPKAVPASEGLFAGVDEEHARKVAALVAALW